MSILHLSMATSGLPSDRMNKAVWACRMCAALTDEAGNVTDRFAVNVRADGRFIDAGASRRHGITTGAANRTGVDEIFVLGAICGMRANGKRTQDRPGLISCARILVGWNADFIVRVISAMYEKHGEPGSAWRRPGLQIISLQEIATPWCKLAPAEDDDQSGQYRRPTRDEAAFALLALPVRPLPHSPDQNLERERALYAELCRRNAIETEAAA